MPRRLNLDDIKQDAVGEVQFYAMRALLRAHARTLTVGDKNQHFESTRQVISTAIDKAHSTGWLAGKQMETSEHSENNTSRQTRERK